MYLAYLSTFAGMRGTAVGISQLWPGPPRVIYCIDIWYQVSSSVQSAYCSGTHTLKYSSEQETWFLLLWTSAPPDCNISHELYLALR